MWKTRKASTPTTCPLKALDEDTACAAWSIRKEQWYDRTLVFESAGVDLRADALK